MGYVVEWLVEGRVVYFKAEGDVTIEDVEDGVYRLKLLLDAGEAPIHTISDNRFVGKFPNSLSTLRKLMTVHPNATGWSVLIQENAAIRFISEMLTRFVVGQNRIKSFTNLPHAINFLERNDAALGKIRNPEGETS